MGRNSIPWGDERRQPVGKFPERLAAHRQVCDNMLGWPAVVEFYLAIRAASEVLVRVAMLQDSHPALARQTVAQP